MLIEPAPAKVNLYLHVVGRQADGYHLLDSLAVFAGVADELRAEPADGLSLSIAGEHAADLRGEPDNLVLRAARSLAAAAGIEPGARLLLDKRLPVASGIGGGSADAAAALRLLARLWNVGIDSADLAALAAAIGKDVPACLGSRPARMRGTGETLSPAPDLPEFGMVLVNPGLPVATAGVFRGYRSSGRAFSPEARMPARWRDAAALAGDLARAGNDLEPAAIALCPAIAEILVALRADPDCLLARMSGSGATCFGLFASPARAETAAARLPAKWWRWGGGPAACPDGDAM